MDAPCRCLALRGPLRSRGYPSRKNPPRGRSPGSVAAHTTPAALGATGRAPMASAPGWVAVSPGQTAFTMTDVAANSATSVLVRAFQSSFADSIRRCRAASECAGEDRIGVGAGAATDVDDPGCALRFRGGRNARIIRQLEQVDLHNAPPSQQYCPAPVITPVVRGLLRASLGPAEASGGPWDVSQAEHVGAGRHGRRSKGEESN